MYRQVTDFGITGFNKSIFYKMGSNNYMDVALDNIHGHGRLIHSDQTHF